MCLLLTQGQIVTNRPITADKLPLNLLLTQHSKLTDTKVRGVQQSSDILEALALAELTVALNVTSHSVDDVGDGFARVGAVGVIVDNRRRIDGAVGAEGIQALVPVDVTASVSICVPGEGNMHHTQRDKHQHRTAGTIARTQHGGSSGSSSTRSCTWAGGS